MLLLHEAELDRVPVDARELVEHAQLLRPQAADAVGLDVVGDHRVHQQGHMAEHVVEHVGLFEVVELVRLADEVARRETPVGQVVEEHLVRHQPGHGDDLPASALHQGVGQAAEIGDPVRSDRQRAHAFDKGVAGAADQQFGLALVQRLPDAMFLGRLSLPALGDGPVGALRYLAGGEAVLGLGGVGRGVVELSQHGRVSCFSPAPGRTRHRRRRQLARARCPSRSGRRHRASSARSSLGCRR